MKGRVIFLCTTPFQAKFCLKIISNFKIKSFDVVYFTKHNSDSDIFYFNKLSEFSGSSQYVYSVNIKKGLNKLFDSFFILKIKKEFVCNFYSAVYVASLDNVLFKYIVKKNSSASLLGFDDGTANITPSSSYYALEEKRVVKVLNFLLRLPSFNEMKLSLSKHYSAYLGFDNFVSADKVSFVSVFDSVFYSDSHGKDSTVFFIGQPFDEYLSSEAVNKLKEWLSCKDIDYYVMHPREVKPLVNNIPVLEKNSQLAEDAIFEKAGKNNVIIFSCYSTVLFNIPSSAADKNYISLSSDREELDRVFIVEKTGSKIIRI